MGARWRIIRDGSAWALESECDGEWAIEPGLEGFPTHAAAETELARVTEPEPEPPSLKTYLETLLEAEYCGD